MSIELIDPGGSRGFQINGGLRIRGGASRDPGNPKHSFRVLFNKKYGAPELKYPLFGPDGASATARFDLRWDHLVSWHYGSGDDATQLPDMFGRDSQLATGSPAKRGGFFHLYLNGQYWGVYQTDERVTADWAAEYFGGGDEDYDIVKFDPEANFGIGYSDGTPAAWRRLFDAGVRGFQNDEGFFRVQGLNPDGSRNRNYERLLDVDNLIDYMLIGIYCAATDNPPSGGVQNNWYGFRSRKNDFGFRFFVHDFELSMASKDDSVLLPEPNLRPFKDLEPESVNPWHFWEAMRQNAEFRQRVADRIQRHFFHGGALTPDATAARWQARMDELDRAIVAESARWGQPTQGRGGPFFENREAVEGTERWGALFGLKNRAPRDIMIDPGPGENPPPKPGGPSPKPGQRPGKQYTRKDWFEAATKKLTDYFPVRTGIVLEQFKAANLYPQLEAPAFVSSANGTQVEIANPNPTGTIYFTDDGSDPRRIGGAVSSKAKTYSAPIRSARQTSIKARILDANTWSAIVEITLQPSQNLSALKLTEIYYNPSTLGGAVSEEGEFLELKNTGSTPLDLSGLRFTAGIDFVFPQGTTLAAGGFFVLARNATVFAQQHPGVTADGVYTGRLANEGETITLSDPGNGEVFSIKYDDENGWPIAADGAGFSLVSKNEGDPNDAESWHIGRLRGSPKADDPVAVFTVRVLINEVLANEDPSLPAAAEKAVEIHNPLGLPADISGWWLTSDKAQPNGFRIPNNTTIPAQGYVVFRASQFAANGVTLPAAGGAVWIFAADSGGTLTGYAHGTEYGAQLDGISSGRVLASDGREYFVAQSALTLGAANAAPLTPTLRLAEINYYPAAGGDEFVELRNFSTTDADISGALLNGMGFTFPSGAAVPASGRALVVGIDPAAFRAKYDVPAQVPIYGPASSPLEDNGELLALQAPVVIEGLSGRLTIEAARYNDRRPWPTAAAGFGSSLQRVNEENFAGEPVSWLPAKPAPGVPEAVNAPPQVTLTSPLNLTSFIPPSIVRFAANATDRDGTIAKVEFLVDHRVVGEDQTAPYEFDWVPASGLHDLTARAIDNDGEATESDFVTIDVEGSDSGAGCGLRGEYYTGIDFSGEPVVRDDPEIDFDWAVLPPAPNVPRKGFSVRWKGKLMPRRSGSHTFFIRAAGGVRLTLGGGRLIDEWDDRRSGVLRFQTQADLSGGEPVDVMLEYFDTDGFAYIDFQWMEPGDFVELAVPQSQLYLPDQNPSALGIAGGGVLPNRSIGRPFRKMLSAANGTRPYTWSVVGGALPPGVVLSAAGEISGTATKAGPFEFRVKVTDRDSATAEKDFRMQINDPRRPDLRPVVTITDPLESVRIGEQDTIKIRGTVKAPRGLAELSYFVETGVKHALPAKSSWQFPLSFARELIPGKNRIAVVARDREGRESERVFVDVFLKVFRPLTVSISGAGTVSSDFLGTTLREVGQSYSIAAAPAEGWVFKQWVPFFASSKTFTFQMQEGLEITAVFEPNPYPALRGNYSGLLLSGTPSHLQRAFSSLSLTGDGSFTSSLFFAGRRYSFRGRFDSFDSYFKSFIEPGTGTNLFLSLTLLRDQKQIDARLSSFDGTNVFDAVGLLLPSTFDAKENPCPRAGQWTYRIDPNASEGPRGSGWATLKVKPSGRASLAGQLADGTKWKTSGVVRDDSALPIYAPLYRRGGSISGDFLFDFQQDDIGSGELFWSKPARAEDPRYPDGFAIFVNSTAARYIKPAAGAAVIPLTDGFFALREGELTEAITKSVGLDANHRFTLTPPGVENIMLSVNPATGVVAGKFVHPTAGKTRLTGIVDQLANTVRGFFLGPQTSGAFEIDQAPPP
jgi:hypothetical protein